MQLACTDDGSTVRSLLRVSRYYNAIAMPYTFRSLSLCGPERMARVSALLQRTPSHLRHIHHLFISDKYAGIDEHSSGRQRALSYPPSVARASDICKIIALAAPTLETLAFCGLVDSTSLISQMFRTHFPELRELSILGFYPFPSSPSTMPKLQRLHLAGNRNPHGLLQLGGLASACPSISHLRLSGIMGAVAFSEELRAAFASQANHDDSRPVPSPASPTAFAAMLPSSIRYVAVQPTIIEVRGGRRGALHAKEEAMMQNLRDLHTRSEESDFARFSLLEGRKQDITVAAMKDDWVKRLTGDDGCWASS
ncbi:hypothetical protein HGRIS_005474 [Hohenbuehelia grisea]|uniref:Uncharacterized protein n=1 Tax=Hohenbuehelia grisea TaxID=104357 RepID=A0ABR3JZ91_9AGAR